jgi:RHS repeat-associated protein
VNPHRYVGALGYYTEPSLGLDYVRARWLRPSIGAWLSADPVLSEPRYQYVGERPTRVADPGGLQPVAWLRRFWARHRENIYWINFARTVLTGVPVLVYRATYGLTEAIYDQRLESLAPEPAWCRRTRHDAAKCETCCARVADEYRRSVFNSDVNVDAWEALCVTACSTMSTSSAIDPLIAR